MLFNFFNFLFSRDRPYLVDAISVSLYGAVHLYVLWQHARQDACDCDSGEWSGPVRQCAHLSFTPRVRSILKVHQLFSLYPHTRLLMILCSNKLQGRLGESDDVDDQSQKKTHHHQICLDSGEI